MQQVIYSGDKAYSSFVPFISTITTPLPTPVGMVNIDNEDNQENNNNTTANNEQQTNVLFNTTILIILSIWWL
eukprot:UN08348